MNVFYQDFIGALIALSEGLKVCYRVGAFVLEWQSDCRTGARKAHDGLRRAS